MTTILETKNLVYRSGGRVLLDGIDLSVAEGSFTIVLGPNGAGKSTLLRMLCGELVPTRGEVTLKGRPLRSLPPWLLAHHRAVMPQASDLTFPFTAFEVACLGVEGLGRGLSLRDRQRIALGALGKADVAHLASRNYQILSGGERQRVQFARVLAQLEAGRTVETRQVLFLDEPIASLDLKHQLALLHATRNLARHGLTVVAVLHDLQLAAGFADEVLLLDEGRVVAQGQPEAVLTPVRLAGVFGVTLATPGLPPHPWSLTTDNAATVLDQTP